MDDLERRYKEKLEEHNSIEKILKVIVKSGYITPHFISHTNKVKLDKLMEQGIVSDQVIKDDHFPGIIEEIDGVGKSTIDKLLEKYDANVIKNLTKKELIECVGEPKGEKIFHYFLKRTKYYLKNDETEKYLNSNY